MKSVFEGNDIFRVGGDEFVVIMVDAEEEKIVKSIGKLHEEAKKNNVSFASGYALTDHDQDIEKALKEADFNMYKDKRKFYNQ